MKHRIKTIIVISASLFLASCGSEKTAKTSKIKKEDYSVYSEYWYDKTVQDVGETSAEVIALEHDFDVMPPGEEGTHRFKIKNTGSNPLHLLVGPKTCKCTGLKIIDREIAPGDIGEVEVKWETVALAKTFNHTASVYTNDSKNKLVRFKVKGKVAVESNVLPNRFILGRFLPDVEEKKQTAVVYSNEWDAFEIKNLKTSFGEAASVKVNEMSDAEKARPEFQRAKYGKSIELTLKNPKKKGSITGFVTFTVVGPDKSVDHEMQVDAKVVRRIRLEETNEDVLTPLGLVRLNRVARQLGKKEKLLLTVLDEDKDLKIKKLIVEPDYVQVHLKPLNSKTLKHGMYTLEIEVPKNQQQGNFNRMESYGKIDIEFDHPRIQPLNLKLDFYVL